jgi:hypothetical protein
VTDDEPAPQPIVEYRFGSNVVILESSKPPGEPGTRVHIVRVKRLGIVRVHRIEVTDSETGHLRGRDLAEYLLLHARYRTMLFAYHE